MRNDTDTALQQGVSSTPTTFVGNLEVASSLEALRTAIQEELTSGP